MKKPYLLSIAILLLSVFSGCEQKQSTAFSLPQRAYVWQRNWNPQVLAAVKRSDGDLAGHVILACEIGWKVGAAGRIALPKLTKVDWSALAKNHAEISPAMRVMPFPGPFSADDETTAFLCQSARQCIENVRAAGIEPRELQLDFDCAQKKLAGYALWVRAVRKAIAPLPLVITTLPCWLDEPDFKNLASTASSWVLQVHSVDFAPGAGNAAIFNPELARGWVRRAAKIGAPFEISLPTYRILSGYDAKGQHLGAWLDGAQPKWPPGTIVASFSADLDAIAELVADWRKNPPSHCKGLLWYRLPVDGDRNNCPWPALRAVMEGKLPLRACQARINGALLAENTAPVSLADISLENIGEMDELENVQVSIQWSGPSRLIAAESLPGWSLNQQDHEVILTPSRPQLRLPLGSNCPIGWLRFDQTTKFYVKTIP